jgi:hypothetical protein
MMVLDVVTLQLIDDDTNRLPSAKKSSTGSYTVPTVVQY